MRFGIYANGAGSTSLSGDNRARRPASNLSDGRRSAPPRPVRPELHPWPKGTFTADVVEVRDGGDDDACTVRPFHSSYDGCVEIGPRDFGFEARQQYPGRVSPVSEEDVSSAGAQSSNVSPSNSLNKRHPGRAAAMRRAFSFESIRDSMLSAASCYSQDAMQPTAVASFDDYAGIAHSNPFEFQQEIDEMRPYASHTYRPEPESEAEAEAERDLEHEEGAYEGDMDTARLHPFAVPMSRYNSQDSQDSQDSQRHRAPPPSRDATEPEKTLDEAWMDIRKAIAPKLQIGVPSRASSANLNNKPASGPTAPASASEAFTKGDLPLVPPPPPIPSRNPKRMAVALGRHATVSPTADPSISRSMQRLSQSSSSPNMANSFKQHGHDASERVPPVPALPSSEASAAHAQWHLNAAVSPVPASNMPMHVPAPLPTPAASACSEDSHFIPPSPVSRHSSTHVPRRHRYSSPVSQLDSSLLPSAPPRPFVPTPPLRFSTHSRASMGQASSSQVPDVSTLSCQLSSPRARGFHEPPPVAPPRSQTVRTPPTHLPIHKSSQSDGLSAGPLSPGIWTGKARGATFTTEIWAGSPRNNASSATKAGVTLRRILPGESATRSSYTPPQTSRTDLPAATRRSSSRGRRDSVIEPDTRRSHSQSKPARRRSGSLSALPTPPSSGHRDEPALVSVPSSIKSLAKTLTSTSRSLHSPATSLSPSLPPPRKDPFAPSYTVALSPKFRVTSPDDFLPKFSNNFAGFCKCAWRHQTAQTTKAFGLRTVTRHTNLPHATSITTKATTIKCKKCTFEGPMNAHPSALSGMSSYAPNIDLSPYADQTPHTAHGVVYRWSFLFKSHVPRKEGPKGRKDENVDPHADKGNFFACVFCCAEGKGTVCFEGAKTLCGHLAKCHPKGVMNGAGDRELRMRVGIVVGRRPDKGEAWDVILPGNRDRSDKAVANWLVEESRRF